MSFRFGPQVITLDNYKQLLLASEKDKAEIQERLKTSLGILAVLGDGFQ